MNPPDNSRQPLVALIILTCNQKEVTLQCLASFEKCTYPNKEIVLVDNGSSDGVLEAVAGAYPGVHRLRNERNLGAAGGRNVGIEYVLQEFSFEYICSWTMILR